MYKVVFAALGFTLAITLIIPMKPIHAASVDESESELIGMGETISFSDRAGKVDLIGLEEVGFRIIGSAFGMDQTNPLPGDYKAVGDVSNAQLITYKNSGLVQYFIQAGYYSIPSLGATYERSTIQVKDSFGLIPLASLTLSPSKSWSITAGKINALGGREGTFTFQNINIDRGLLWNQTANISRGAAVKYSEESMTAAITLNDGFYSNKITWMGASLAYDVSPASSASFSWSGSIKQSSADTFITPLAQNNSQIFTAAYNYKSDRWKISPYIQYTYVPEAPSVGIMAGAQTRGAALLASYQIARDSTGIYSLPFRVEYIGSSGQNGATSPNLLYGTGSSAWSGTITPTFQKNDFFARAEFSYVRAINITPGLGFGSAGMASNQMRIMMEAGILY